MNTFGIAVALAGVILFLAALLATLRANRDNPIPYWTRPVSEARHSAPMRALGAGLTVFGAALMAQNSGWWALFVVLAVRVSRLSSSGSTTRESDSRRAEIGSSGADSRRFDSPPSC
jgi:hypothetical protein